jgi:hypothetical protein
MQLIGDTKLNDYLAQHNRLRVILLSVGFVVASFALYVALALGYIGIPGAGPDVLWDRIIPALSLIAVLTIDVCIAWMLFPNSNRGFGTRLLQTSAMIIAGAILTSLAVMREHWLEMMKELVRRI